MWSRISAVFSFKRLGEFMVYLKVLGLVSDLRICKVNLHDEDIICPNAGNTAGFR